MPRKSYERGTCKDCGKTRTEVGHVTWRGYCGECGKRRMHTHNAQLHEHAGAHFEIWRQRMAASVGAILVEDLEQLLTED